MTRALALLAALVLAACAGPRPITSAGMEQIARDWRAADIAEHEVTDSVQR